MIVCRPLALQDFRCISEPSLTKVVRFRGKVFFIRKEENQHIERISDGTKFSHDTLKHLDIYHPHDHPNSISDIKAGGSKSVQMGLLQNRY